MRHSPFLRWAAVVALLSGVTLPVAAQTDDEEQAAAPEEQAEEQAAPEEEAEEQAAPEEAAETQPAPQEQAEEEPETQPAPEEQAATQPAPEMAARSAAQEEPWVRDVHARAGAALVTIRCGWHRGTGFVFGSDDRVATTGWWDHCTRAITVRLPDGRTVAVERGRVSWHGGVALLRLPNGTGVEPLSGRDTPVHVGEPVVAVAHERAGDGAAVIAAGMVTAEPGDTIRTDLDPPPGSTGGPVLDADGDVIGVLAQPHGFGDEPRVVPVSRLDDLGERAADEPLGRTFSFGIGPFGALVLDEDPAVDGSDVWLGGFGAALSATLADRLTLVGGFSVLRDASGLFEDGVVKRTVRRYQAEARLGWRLLLSSRWPVYVIPSLGASARWDRWTDRRLRVQLADPTCDLSDGSACELTTDVVREHDDDFSITPYAHLALRLGFLEIGYTISLAVDAPGTFVHRFLLGAWMGS